MRVENIPYPRQVISVNSRTAPVVEPIMTERKADFEAAPSVPALRPRRSAEAFALLKAVEAPPAVPAPLAAAPALLQAPLTPVAVYAPAEEPAPAPPAPSRAAQAHYAPENAPSEPTISIYV